MACLHGGGGPQVGEVTSAVFNVQAFFCENSSPLQCGFKNVTKYLGNMSENAKYLGKLFQKMVQKSKIESRRIFENSNGPSFRSKRYLPKLLVGYPW